MSASAVSPVVAAASSGGGGSSLWILDPWKDLLLFVATPLLVVPLGLLLRRQWSPELIYAFMGAFGGAGHHLPGMMRAYGDRALFQRFRIRFIVAPVFLLGLCLAYGIWELKALTLAIYLWAIWHGQMQTYGFVRIYDVKLKALDPLTARLDYAMCAAWFLGTVLLSPERVRKLLDLFYSSGGPLIAGERIASVIAATPWVMGAITLAFAVNFVARRRAGQGSSPVKLGLMATSFGFWWYTNVGVGSLLIGIALFEIFHDVQYLSIVWLYNRRRTRETPDLGSFIRFVFGRSNALIGVYVGLVLCYGYLAWLASYVPTESVTNGLQGLFAASALLHFYFDGFIWKVREASTRASLGLEGGSALPSRAVAPRWLSHGAKWLLLVVPLGWLGAAQVVGTVSPLDRAVSVAGALPTDAIAQYNLGAHREQQGDLDAALRSYRAAIALDATLASAQGNLGNLLAARGDATGAIEAYRAALRAQPDDALAHHNLGIALMNAGDSNAAIAEIREAVRLKPDFAQGFHDLGAIVAHLGRTEESLRWYRAALQVDPDYARAHGDLGSALLLLGDFEQAAHHLSEARRLQAEQAAR